MTGNIEGLLKIARELNSGVSEKRVSEKRLFALGRKVSGHFEQMQAGTLRPRDSDFSNAAKELGISKSLAREAWNKFTWG